MIVSYAQNYEDVMLWRALNQVPNGFYIDVGANDPSVDSVTRLFYERGWRGVNIEPLSQHFMDLQRARPRDVNLQCAAGPAVGSVEIWECGVRGWATADQSVVQAHESQGRTGKYVTVPMSTLAAICAQYAPPDIHFLKVDVEGFERAVLQGMNFSRFRPWVVVVEATRPNSTFEVHEAWEDLLLTQAYDFVYADGLNRFYLARERSALSSKFVYPPNFFDDFVVVSRVEAEARAVLAETCLDQALARASQAQAQAAQAEARVSTILNSRSWRMTAPLRWMMEAKLKVPNRASWAPKAFLRRAIAETVARPRLRRLGSKLLQRVPALRQHLNSLTSASTIGPADPLGHLPRRIRRLYDALSLPVKDAAPAVSLDCDNVGTVRLKLAYVSPLPPQRSGIADYSAQLLPELSKIYDIELVVYQSELSDAGLQEKFVVRSVEWFTANSHHYDRVLYHFGNSSYHQHMFPMLEQVPGVVVLHDFFLGGVLDYLEQSGAQPFAMSRALYVSHGYAALAERYGLGGPAHVAGKYPVNFEVVNSTHGVIVHSQHAASLADQWYGDRFAESWSVVPLVRTLQRNSARENARLEMGLKADDFLVCSFGLMGSNKLNLRLLEAWFGSRLAKDQNCMLVFVGDEHRGEYGEQIRRVIQTSAYGARVRILGWSEQEVFANYLAATDMAVQLRCQSRGESSAAVLDCMNHGVATIVNAHGSFADLPRDGVWMLPELFDKSQMVDALEALWSNRQSRLDLGERGRNWVLAVHAPQICAAQYAQAIERGYAAATRHDEPLRCAQRDVHLHQPTQRELISLAQSLGRTLSHRAKARQWLVDVSGTCRMDPKTGIQRVVRALVWELIQNPPPGCRVEPVYLTDLGGQWHYRYAREWTSGALSCPSGWMPDEPVEFFKSDILLVADFISEFAAHAEQADVYGSVRRHEAEIHFFVYDLLPLQMPHCFPPNRFGYTQWLDTLVRVADGVVCISQAVANDLREWLNTSDLRQERPLQIEWFHLGADIQKSIPTVGMAKNFDSTLARLAASPSFLMVGTLEPRKGYLQSIAAFSQLWRDGHEVNLVIVGTEGWRGMPDNMRRTIPQIMATLRKHPEFGKRLIWLDSISDEFLEKVYAASTCLIAASEGEGFGLPLIEAAQHGLPIIARDIPVFKEVAGDHAYYFDGLEPKQLADAVLAWLALSQLQKAPASSQMPWLTWEQSVHNLVTKCFGKPQGNSRFSTQNS